MLSPPARFPAFCHTRADQNATEHNTAPHYWPPYADYVCLSKAQKWEENSTNILGPTYYLGEVSGDPKGLLRIPHQSERYIIIPPQKRPDTC